MSHKGINVAAWLCVALLAVSAWSPRGHAQDDGGASQAPDTTIDSLVGEKAVVFLRGFPVVDKREIIQLHGTVTAAVAQGIWFKPVNRRFKIDKKGDDRTPYAGPLFVPWTSISYLKVVRK